MKNLRFLPLLTILSAALSFVTVILLHFLRTDYNPLSRYVSEYAIGPFGQIAALSFSLFGISIISFYLQTREKFSKAGISLLVWGLALIIVGLFNTDLKKMPLTPHGTIHVLATGIGFGSFIFGSFSLNKKLKYSSIFKKLSWIMLSLLLFLALGVLADKLYAYNLSVPFPLNIMSDIVGLIERIVLLASAVWFSLAVYLNM